MTKTAKPIEFERARERLYVASENLANSKTREQSETAGREYVAAIANYLAVVPRNDRNQVEHIREYDCIMGLWD